MYYLQASKDEDKGSMIIRVSYLTIFSKSHKLHFTVMLYFTFSLMSWTQLLSQTFLVVYF